MAWKHTCRLCPGRSSQPERASSFCWSPRSIEPPRASQIARLIAGVDRASQGEQGHSAGRSSRSSQPERARSLSQSNRSIEPARANKVARLVAQVDRASQREPGCSPRSDQVAQGLSVWQRDDRAPKVVRPLSRISILIIIIIIRN